MSELAFNQSGETFDVPASVVAWRVRRLKPRGAPEIVYASNGGGPLTLPIEADYDDLREAVTTSGKYRLDPINEAGKCVENVPAAYIYVTKSERNADLSNERAPDTRGDVALAGLGQAIVEAVKLNSEAMRQNAEIAMRAVDRLPQLMDAMTTALNVASGTGLHALQQRELVPASDEYIDEADEAPPAPAIPGVPAGIDLNAILGKAVADLTMEVMKKVPSLGGILDPRKAHAEGQKQRQAKQQAAAPAQAPAQATHAPAVPVRSAPPTRTTTSPSHAMPRMSDATPSAPPSAAVAAEPQPASATSTTGVDPDAATMLHLYAIQNALGPGERDLATAIAEELTPEQRRAWFGELKALSVEDAVHKIRTELVRLTQSASATPTIEPQETTSSTEGGAS